MPTYEYICDSCFHEFDVFQSMSADRLTKCPQCEEESLRRKIGIGAGIIFKGSGFYETDYKKKPKPENGDDAKKPEASKDSGKDSSPTSSKDDSSKSSQSSASASSKKEKS
jgi:putative FmdB family regulatory protein